MNRFTADGIVPVAISPDSPQVLADFATGFGIDYPLLADQDSEVIRAWGLFNHEIEPDHAHYGIPHPGMFLVDEQGMIFDKHFGPDHRIRESVANVLQERFGLPAGHDGVSLETDHGRIRAWFSAPTVRPQQLNFLTIEIDVPPGEHIYGEPLPEGYIPLHVHIEADEELLSVDEIQYPRTKILHMPVLDEHLPVYDGLVKIKVLCRGLTTEVIDIEPKIHIRLQACDENLCHPPQDVELKLPLRALPND